MPEGLFAGYVLLHGSVTCSLQHVSHSHVPQHMLFMKSPTRKQSVTCTAMPCHVLACKPCPTFVFLADTSALHAEVYVGNVGKMLTNLGKEYFATDKYYVSPLPPGLQTTGCAFRKPRLLITNTIQYGRAGPKFQVSMWIATCQQLVTALV